MTERWIAEDDGRGGTRRRPMTAEEIAREPPDPTAEVLAAIEAEHRLRALRQERDALLAQEEADKTEAELQAEIDEIKARRKPTSSRTE